MFTSEISRCARGSRARVTISLGKSQAVLLAAVAIALIVIAAATANGQNFTTPWLLALAGGTLLQRRRRNSTARGEHDFTYEKERRYMLMPDGTEHELHEGEAIPRVTPSRIFVKRPAVGSVLYRVEKCRGSSRKKLAVLN